MIQLHIRIKKGGGNLKKKKDFKQWTQWIPVLTRSFSRMIRARNVSQVGEGKILKF